MRSDLLVGVILCALSAFVRSDNANPKVVCYYNGNSVLKEGLGKVTLVDIDAALPFCTHLVYGYAGIRAETKKLVSLNENLDLDQGKGNYRLMTILKRRYPNLKVMLSVGGNADPDSEVYLTLLESSVARMSFINSAYTILKTYEFDGLDLAWQFPVVKPKKIRSSIGSVWHKFKKTFSGDSVVDPSADDHREQFTSFVKDLKNAFRHDGYILSVTMLPNVNAAFYIDVPAIINNLDFVIVSAFDHQTPDRNPKEADFPAPIYVLNDRNADFNIDAEVKFFINNKAPASKIVVGIPTYGRAWNMVGDSGTTGVPPLLVEGAANPGLQSNISGLLSWPEICAKLPNPSNIMLKGEDAPMRKVGDPSKRFGSYAFRLPDDDGKYGMWVGYEDPDTAGNKAGYVKSKNLGGIAIFDLSYDDFRGACVGEKFPILRAAKYRL